MTQKDKRFLVEFALGSLFGVGLFVGIVSVAKIIATTEKKPPEKYEIVDHYGTCAVVRYIDDWRRDHYFLDCREVR